MWKLSLTWSHELMAVEPLTKSRAFAGSSPRLVRMPLAWPDSTESPEAATRPVTTWQLTGRPFLLPVEAMEVIYISILHGTSTAAG